MLAYQEQSAPRHTLDDVYRLLIESGKFSAPIDVDFVAKSLGVLVECDFSLEQDDVIGQIEFSGKTPLVKINPVQNMYRPRYRFTLAHELGHYYLHTDKASFKDNKKSMSRTSSYWDVYESEANDFAASLLMPSELVIQIASNVIDEYLNAYSANFISVGELVKRMAARFEVSNKAMEYRLKNLGFF